MNNADIKKWINENLVMRDEAMQITEQSLAALRQCRTTRQIISSEKSGKKRKTSLYTTSNCEDNKKHNIKYSIHFHYAIMFVSIYRTSLCGPPNIFFPFSVM